MFTIFVTACSKSNNIPPPPKAETDLIYSLFNSLKNDKYQIAVQKVKRLRLLSPSDYYLANIEYKIEIDSEFAEVQNSLDDGKINKAKEIIDNAVQKYGARPQLLNARKKLNSLVKANKLTEKIVNAKTSSEIAIPTGELNRLIQTNKFIKPLKTFTDYSLDRARILMSREEIMAVNDLKADIDVIRITDSSILSTAIAQLSIEKAKDRAVQNYEKLMSSNWKDLNTDNSIIKSDNDILLFRQALNSKADVRNNIYKRLLNIPPDSFSSMLIRAFILIKTGYSEEGNALSSVIRNSFQLDKNETAGWYKTKPDKFTDFYSINPFVLYPFFVYCE